VRALQERTVIGGVLLAGGSAALGGALALASRRRPVLLELTRTFAFTAALGVVGFHLLPEILPALGPTALLWIAAGFVLPWLLEVSARVLGPAVLARRGIRGMRVAAEVGFAALVFHSLFEGLALLATLEGRHNSTDLAIAIVAHHAPLTAAVALPFLDLLGVRSALIRVALAALAGMAGVVFGQLVPGLASGADADAIRYATAVVAGALLHVVADEIHEQHFSSSTHRALDVVSAVLGLSLAALGGFLDARVTPAILAFVRACTALALAAGPALVLSITAEIMARRLPLVQKARTVLDGFFVTAALLGWAAAAARVALSTLFVVSLWFGGRRLLRPQRERLVDELAPRGPWLAALLLLAGAIQVLAPARWFTDVGPSGLLLIAAVLGGSAQASASGAALVACALVYRGLSAELAVPFLALGALPVRRTPLLRSLAGAVAGVAAAFAAGAVLTRFSLLRGAAPWTARVLSRAADPVVSQILGSPLAGACAAAVFALAVALAFRSGVRGWFAPLRHADPHEHAAHDHAPAGAS
jgi:hypothetical protein